MWDDYEMHCELARLHRGGMFANHDPEHGRTLYGAEVMVRPELAAAGDRQEALRGPA